MSFKRSEHKGGVDISESSFQKLVYTKYIKPSGRYDFAMPNCYSTHDNECDVMAIRKSGFYDEFEIKISRSDFFADAKKSVYVPNPNFVDWKERTEKHRDQMIQTNNWSTLEWYCPVVKVSKAQALNAGQAANFFWYVVPLGLVSLDEIPKHAGMIAIHPCGGVQEVKSAPSMHKVKMTDQEKYKIARKACYRIWGDEKSA